MPVLGNASNNSIQVAQAGIARVAYWPHRYSRMKALARSYMWWSGLDIDMEDLAKSCVPCQSVKHAPPLKLWIWPAKPFERVHVDLAGPMLGTMLFALVDAHSKWPEVFMMSATTTGMILKYLERYLHHMGCQTVSE